MSPSAYPQPTVTQTNKPLLDAWSRGELALQHCNACGQIVFFPRDLCPRCWSTDFTWKRSTGVGRIVSFSRVYSHVTEPFLAEAPTVLAEIALEDGGAMLARVIAADPQAVASGMAVELVPMP